MAGRGYTGSEGAVRGLDHRQKVRRAPRRERQKGGADRLAEARETPFEGRTSSVSCCGVRSSVAMRASTLDWVASINCWVAAKSASMER